MEIKQKRSTNKLHLRKKLLNNLQDSLNKKESGLMMKYNEHPFKQLSLGFIEKVKDVNHQEGILHYIPHFPAFKKDSATTKMRIVYDTSARMSTKALSLMISDYPNLMQDLTGILLKFRTCRKGLLAGQTQPPRQGHHKILVAEQATWKLTYFVASCLEQCPCPFC